MDHPMAECTKPNVYYARLHGIVALSSTGVSPKARASMEGLVGVAAMRCVAIRGNVPLMIASRQI